MFSTHSNKNLSFKVTIISSSSKAFNLDQSKKMPFGKELKLCGKDILVSFFCLQMKTVALVVFVFALVSSDVHGLAVKEFPSSDGDIAEKPLVSRISSFSDNVSHLFKYKSSILSHIQIIAFRHCVQS